MTVNHDAPLFREEAHILTCNQRKLVSILHLPKSPKKRGVLIIVGGPQYRVGGHRYFVTLARALAAAGYAVMRFDYRGMGDSEGVYPGFENLEDDIRTAIDALFDAVPALEEVGLWGLCNAASAAAFYVASDRRVDRIMLLNPWVRDDDAYDVVLLRHYYARRAFEATFWRGLLSGKTRIFDFPRLLWRIAVRKISRKRVDNHGPAASLLAHKLAAALSRFKGEVQLVLSGRDLTAKEFEQEVARLDVWNDIKSSPRFSTLRLDEADHTFSEPEWSEKVTKATHDWLGRKERPAK